MEFLNRDYLVYDRYADIIKKYSKDHSGSKDTDVEDWKITNGEDNATPRQIFSAYIDCLLSGAAIGLAKHRKIKDPGKLDRSHKANILLSAWKSRRRDFEYLYRLMILTDPDLNLDKDQRVKKAFTDVPDAEANKEMEFFMQYAYGGLIELDNMLSEVKSYTDLCNVASRICTSFDDDEDE